MNLSKQSYEHEVGEIVFFKRPTFLHVKGYGIRMYVASQETEEFGFEDEKYPVKKSDIPKNGFGVVVSRCFEPYHGAGTFYYKVLLNQKLYWVSSVFLNKSPKPNQ